MLGAIPRRRVPHDRNGGEVIPPPRLLLRGSEVPFYTALALIGGLYVGLIAALLIADLTYTSPGHVAYALASP